MEPVDRIGRREFLTRLAGAAAAVALLGAWPARRAVVRRSGRFREFGPAGREDFGAFEPRPWRLEVTGLVERPALLGVDALLASLPRAERVDEGGVLWGGAALADFVDWARPLPGARYLRLVSFKRPDQAPGQRDARQPWPYVGWLSLDRATLRASLLASHRERRPLPVARGAPLRLVAPGEPGRCGVKSIARIEFAGRAPAEALARG